jgi:UDP:flavonoid glycosyltransferase YjiC (YdhE family)
MKIVLVTFGSRGDVQPMLALALALQREGHDVLLAGPPERAEWAGEYGCPYQPLGNNLTAFVDLLPQAHTLRSGYRFISYIYKEMTAQFEVLPEIIKGADLVVGASLVLALSTVAEHMEIPYRFIAFCPQLLPSGFHPFPAIKTQVFPRWVNRITWRMRGIIDRLGLSRMLNNKRMNLGLKAINDPWLHALGQQVIVASDKEIVGLPDDLEIGAVQTGYLHLLQHRTSNPSLERFIESGPPPVYAGFGSMPRSDQAGNVSMIVEAARSTGQRVIIAKFWDGPTNFPDAKDIFFLKGYPHLELFPNMSMVIHHGGAGTTATSAISGVPQIIVPHVLDQYYWGHHIFRSQLGPRPIRRSRMTSQKLATAILECLANDRMRKKAKDIASRIRQRDSLGLTCKSLSLS